MQDPDLEHDLRPSARSILQALSEHGEMSARELIDETGLARGTVNELLPSLKRRGFVTARPSVMNPRADVYEYSRQSRASSLDHDEDDGHDD